jgi:hypothetical protein
MTFSGSHIGFILLVVIIVLKLFRNNVPRQPINTESRIPSTKYIYEGWTSQKHILLKCSNVFFCRGFLPKNEREIVN